jgi:hypothetical protein
MVRLLGCGSEEVSSGSRAFRDSYVEKVILNGHNVNLAL